MKGFLVVNSFMNNKKFQEQYLLLQNAAKKFNFDLEIKTGISLLCDIENNFSNIKIPDFILFWDKDIYLAKRLEELKIPFFNSSKAIEICDNKILTYLCLKNKVKIPKTIIAPKTFEGINYSDLSFLDKAIEILKLPFIIKEAYGSFGQQVYLVNNKEEAKKVISKIGYKDFLMQEFIKSSYGKDLRINVVGGKVISSMLRYNENDFRSNISNGGKSLNYQINEKQKEIAIKTCDIIGLDYAGVDILFGENDEPIVCEVNSNPHFKSSFLATGIDMSLKIMEYIKNKLC